MPSSLQFKNKKKWLAYYKAYREKDKFKVRARKKLYVMVRNGTIKKEPCFCGENKSEAHHEDYNFPYKVIWLCKEHHAMADKSLRERKNHKFNYEESWVCMCNNGLGKILTPNIEKCEDCGTEKLFHLSHKD